MFKIDIAQLAMTPNPWWLVRIWTIKTLLWLTFSRSLLAFMDFSVKIRPMRILSPVRNPKMKMNSLLSVMMRIFPDFPDLSSNSEERIKIEINVRLLSCHYLISLIISVRLLCWHYLISLIRELKLEPLKNFSDMRNWMSEKFRIAWIFEVIFWSQ